ncbi:MAG: hypothetical protein IJ113_03365 [Eggerthellaceae bacterium]|nr:hypothetical protein [Eggerthellaceae bacterium]MBQ9147792.1 hypothetical protein [Rikenellaceae bacterium]
MDEWEQYRYNQARAWLEHVRGLADAVDSAERAVEYERAQMEQLSSIDYARVRVSGTPTSPDIADILDRLNDNIRQYCANASAYTDERRDCYDRLSRLESKTEAKALQLRYCMNHSWEYIEGAMGYTEGGIMKLRRTAIIHAYDVMPIEQRDPMHQAL